jgi:transcriptional antiterminator NusG
MTTETTDTAESLRADLQALPGEWYVARAKVGAENLAKTNLMQRVQNLGIDHLIFQAEAPTQQVATLKYGQRKVAKKTVMPGYVLIRMELTDESWAAVKNTPGISGFVGATTLPTPLPINDVVKFLLPPAAKEVGEPAGAAEHPEVDVIVCDFSIGDAVTVIEGPFTGYHASVSEVDVYRRKLHVLVSIFGRDTPVELGFDQIERM